MTPLDLEDRRCSVCYPLPGPGVQILTDLPSGPAHSGKRMGTSLRFWECTALWESQRDHPLRLFLTPPPIFSASLFWFWFFSHSGHSDVDGVDRRRLFLSCPHWPPLRTLLRTLPLLLGVVVGVIVFDDVILAAE